MSRRHAEILLALADAGPRLLAGSVLQSGPYRFAPGGRVDVAVPDEGSRALPGSSTPVVRRRR